MEPIRSILESIPSIPTEYKGIRFRSRLEAKWAAFFDCCDWPWVYEPYDLDGWIPDFQLGKRGMLVEVKPFNNFDAFSETIKKIESSGIDITLDVLLLGTAPQFTSEWGSPVIGWIGQRYDCDKDWAFADAQFGRSAVHRRFVICHATGGWYDATGNVKEEKGKHENPGYHDEDEFETRDFWGQATNITQWRPR